MQEIMKRIKNLIRYVKDGSYKAKLLYTKYYEKLSINENKILIEAFFGANCNGNPYYLLLELCRNKKYSKYKKYISVQKNFKDSMLEKIESLKLENVELVIRHSNRYLRLLAQAKYLINNVSFPTYFIKKQGQIYLNTWHGTPLKGLGRNIQDNPHSIGNVQKNFLMSDYLLYPNYYSFENMKKDYMIEQFFEGKYVLAGYPCNEIFFNKQEADTIRREFGIEDKKVIIYMPTWRKNEILHIKSALSEFEQKLDDDTILYVKLHHLTSGEINFEAFKKIKPFPNKYETYEFLSIADGLITDYSSVMFDFANTGRKIMLYTYDKEEYMNTRSMYFDINELPFTNTDKIDNIIEEIKNINQYEKYEDFRNKFCEFDNGSASKVLCDYIFNGQKSENIMIINGKKFRNNKKNILIFAGDLSKNGITTAFKGIMNHVDLEKNNYFLTFYKNKLEKNKIEIKDLNKQISYIPMHGLKDATIKETICLILYFIFNINTKFVQNTVKTMWKREIKRNFPTMKFDYVIHFTGYAIEIMHLFANMDAKKIIYTHNDLSKERKTRKNVHINSLKMVYKEYDKIAIIRETMKNEIINNVKDVDESKIYLAHNINNINQIKEKSVQDIVFDEDTYCNYNIQEVKNILEDDKSIKFINIARYSKEKGLNRLIKAFNKFRKENTNSYLIIIGGHGKDFNKIRNMVNKEEMKNIILIKSLRNPYSILKKCDAFILSSFYEGLPMTIMEALILDKPVISTNITGPKEFLEKGYGYLVDDSEQGILNGMKEYKKGNLSNLKKFDAKEFNKKAIQEFYEIIN